MIKSLTIGICALAFTTSLAFAQTGQAPTTTSGMRTHSAMDANAKMTKKKKMKMKKGMMKSDSMKSDDMKKDGMSK